MTVYYLSFGKPPEEGDDMDIDDIEEIGRHVFVGSYNRVSSYCTYPRRRKWYPDCEPFIMKELKVRKSL